MSDEDDFKAMEAEAKKAETPQTTPTPTNVPAPVPSGAIAQAPPLASAAPSAPPAATANSDDLSSDYLSHKDAIDTQAAFEQMNREAQGQPATATAAEKPEPTSAPATPHDVVRAASRPIPGAAMIYDEGTHQYRPDPNVKPGGVGLAAMGSDVGRGSLESPRMVVKGARDAVQSVLDLADKIAAPLSKALLGEKEFEREGPLTLPGAKMDEPTTVTGSLVKNTTQFIASMSMVGKALMGMKVPSSIQGALALFTGFEGHQQRLSDLIQANPKLANPVNDFLSSKPGDSEVVGRLKNAAEGLGLGALSDGFIGALRLLKGGNDAAAALNEAAGEPSPGPPPETPAAAGTVEVQATNDVVTPAVTALDKLGDPAEAPEEPLVKLGQAGQAEKQDAARAATAGIEPDRALRMAEPATPEELAGPKVPGATEAQAKEPEFHINFARINGPDDVKRALSEMASAQSENVEAARRGIQTFEDTKIGAATKDAFQLLMDRRVGQSLNDQEMLAARQLEYQSAARTVDAIYAAADNPTPENIFAYRKMMQTHAMISAEVRGAQAETARALSAMRIPVGEGDAVRRMGSLMQQLDNTGGLEANIEDLYKMRSLVDSGDMASLNAVAEKSMYARTRDALLTGWTNGLLTNPLTHIKVSISNAATIALRLTETKVAESMDRLMGNQNGVVAGETAQTAAGLVSSIKDAFRFVAKSARLPVEAPESNPLSDAAAAFKSGHYSVGSPSAGADLLDSSLASDTNAMSDSGWLGKGIDLAGQVIRTPGRALTAEHEFFRSIGMRMELNRFAIRKATEDLNSGRIAQDAFQGRVAELIENAPANVTEQAVNGMTYQTFTDAPGKLAAIIEQIRNDFPLSRVIVPFYKIPARMLSFTFERTPLAPLTSVFRENVAAGGARASMAIAQMGVGSMVTLAAADHVLNGQMTGAGPKERGQREAMENEGWLPYSVKVGDKWFQYNRLETIGSAMALAADVTETIRDFHTAVNADDPDTTNLAAALGFALANDITSKSYLEGIANFFQAMGNPGEAKFALQSLAGSVVPAGMASWDKNAPKQVGGDPYKRQVQTMVDAIKARTPGQSESLPPQRNVWGEPISNQSGMGRTYDAFVPFQTRQSKNEPIDKELLRLGLNVTLPPAKETIGNAKVDLKQDPKIYSRYVQLAGNETPMPLTGKGTKDSLNDLVNGTSPLSPIYDLYKDEGKKVMIENIVRSQRAAAKQQLLQEFPEFAAKVNDLRDQQQDLRSLATSGR